MKEVERRKEKRKISSSDCDLSFEEVRLRWGFADSDPVKTSRHKIK